MTKLVLILSFLASLLALTNGQSYLPRPVVKTSCSSGTFVSIGNNSVAATDVHLATTSVQASYILTTIYNVTTPSTTISQLSWGLSDNFQITTVALVRMGLYSVSGVAMTKLAQTAEVMLYATSATTIYADLLTPVTVQRGTYAIAIWSNTALMTGVNNVVTGMTANSLSSTYTSNGLPSTFTASTILGGKAVAMVGCSSGEDPWSGPTIAYYSFCLAGAYTTPSIAATFSSSTIAVTFNGVVAVNTAASGTTSQGQYYTVTAGNARYSTVTYAATSTSFTAATTQAARTFTTGGNFGMTFDQRLYPASSQGVDYQGISFQDAQGTQFILQYQNGTHEIMMVSPGSSSTIQMDVAVFSAQSVSSADAAFPTCSTTASSYVQQQFTCPAGQTPVEYGDSADFDAILTTNLSTSLINANYVVMRPFTANIPGTTLYQLSWLINTNPFNNRIGRIRLGLFTNNGAVHTLVQQTQEIKLWGTTSTTLLKANLIQPVVLVQDRNYSIGVVADSPIYTSYASYGSTPTVTTLPFQQTAPTVTGFKSPLNLVNMVTTVLPVGASGCTSQTTTKYTFCAAFVYASYNQLYSGVLTTVGTQTDEKGTFRPVIEGTGTYNYTYTSSSTLAPKIYRFTLHDYNLDGDNRLYTVGNLNSPVNEFGLEFVVQAGAAAGFAAQLKSTYDPFREEFMFKENTQGFSSSTVTFLTPIVSTFTIAPYVDGQPIPSCPVPTKPANVVSPLIVARATCLNNDMTDVFGDTDVGNFDQHVDGTLIQGDRIYTQRFTADSAAVVSQLAVGILQNTDRPGAIQVRLGLYAQANNSLIAQTSVLTINQAVAQLIIMNVPFSVSIQQGSSYLIAILASAPLEVAHTSTASSASMAVTFSATGLPATFVSSGNDVSPSIAAYACVSATHSFCASFQYYTSNRETVSYLYQGLIQTAPTTQTNPTGTFLPIWAAAGRLVSYRRTSDSATQVSTLFSFWQRPGTTANLYTISNNGKALDSTGIFVQTSLGVDSNLQFNASINKYDESFSFTSTLLESDMFFSNFSFTPLGAQYGIPVCGLGSLPTMKQEFVPLPVCESTEEVVTYGTGDQFTLSSNTEGVNGLPGGQIFLRQITTDGAKWSIMSQLKFGINVNLNTINYFRMGVYDVRMQFLAGTEDVLVYNTNDYIATGFLREPLYLAPATVYYLAVWTSGFVYAGFTAGGGPSMIAPLVNDVYEWPQQFVDTNPNSLRAIGGFGCTTSRGPSQGFSSSSTSNPFVSSSRFSSSAMSSSRFSSSAISSSAMSSSAQSSSRVSSSAMSSSAREISSTGASSSSAASTISSSSATFVEAGSSTKSGLESGAIAGVVIGCVIGSNMILLFCIWCCCLGGMAAGKTSQHKELEESRVGETADDHEIEMQNAE